MIARLQALRRRAQIVLLRALPLPAAWKEWLVWWLLPRFTIGVAAVIFDEHGRVLVLRSAWHGGWQLPGGAAEYGERLDGAMQREAREELGLEFASLERIALFADRSGRRLHALYRATLAPGPIHLSEEHVAWAYREVERLPPAVRYAVALARGDVRPEPL